jgi:DNA-binding CsgD family transcriptional regulator
VEQIAVRSGLSPGDVADAESRLFALGLLRRSPGGGRVAISPESAADALLAPMEQDILQRRIAMAAARARLHALSGDYLEARSLRSAKSSIEVVEGIDNIRAVIDDLARTCVKSIDGINPGRPTEEALTAAAPLDLEALERGVRRRQMFQLAVRRNRTVITYAEKIIPAGAQLRFASVLPASILIYDRSCAMLPLDPQRAAAGAAVVRDPAVLNFLQQLFEHYWELGQDFAQEEPSAGPEPTGAERDVLLLMAAGKKDEAIAHQLGMSPRSVSRIVARLMERLGAESRFQAGARAAQSGWLS